MARSSAAVASPWSTPEERAREREQKREAVLGTAVRFFNTKGFHATSLDDVALALNVTKPTIYHYFASKDEVLFECVRRGLESIRESATTAAAHGGTGRERLRTMLLDYAIVMTKDFGICVSRTQDTQLSPDSRTRFRALKREIDIIIRHVIEEGIADGSIKAGDPRLATFTVTGALNWIAHWYDPEGRMSAQDVAEGTVAMLLTGLSPGGKD
ncbi:TetR/AcrR family transcriptional regulator [Microvirga puerhi]|uniref:TetR/AcrR family transcriptional regulator n=1 Tax=Microvirga puerhi TaxID=2876078 RepID=A0ABS7VUF4_9HYPH|nr:TetR/AcrR family transcriptional regulator [Microvirga puerhi]MBZ6078488.1 TetR/AcrR family transcriptional regulator [Microvirga puerhi]